MEWLETTPLDATALRPMTLPANCYGKPGSRRWDVGMEPPRGGNNLGDSMETYIKLYPDPRTARGYYQSLPGTTFPLEDLTDVVVRELIKYLPPMSIIQLANMLENFRREVLNNKKAFDTRICPCNTEIIGNQCWRHTKTETNLFRKIKPTMMRADYKPIAIEQVEELRRRIDRSKTRRGATRHYGGTEGWNRRYAKPSGLHEAMLLGKPHELAEMFPPGTIEDGIIHVTIHAAKENPSERTVINTLGLLLLRLTGAAITIHSIRMKGRLDQTQSDAMSDLMRRQGGAACQLCIEGEQQIRNADWHNAPRWTTISNMDRSPESRLPPIPHLLNNFFVRASLAGIEEQTATWETTMTGAMKDGKYSPDIWMVVEPYLRSTRTGETQIPNRPPGSPRSYPGSPSLGSNGQGPCMEAGSKCPPIPPISHQQTDPEEDWRYMNYYNPSENQAKTCSDPDQLRMVRRKRLGDIEWWELDRKGAEWARYNEMATYAKPKYTDRRDLLSEDEDSDTGKDAEKEDPESGEQDEVSLGELPKTPPNSAWGSNHRPFFKELHSPAAEDNNRYMRCDSGGSSETEPGSPVRPDHMECDSGGSSETEPGSPGWSGDRTVDRGEPSKVKTEEQGHSRPIKTEKAEPTRTRNSHSPDTGSHQWPETGPWSEPESQDTWDYYLSSDGVTRNYYFIEYGPGQGQAE